MTKVAKIEHEEAAVSTVDPMVNAIERFMTDPNADIDKLERMLAMKERLDDRARQAAKEDRADEAKRAYWAAMAKAQAEIPVIIKNRDNDHTKSKFADLAAIEKQAMPIIHQHGFSVSANSVSGAEQGMQRVRMFVAHKDGHVEKYEDDYPLDGAGAQGRANKTGVQAKGSTITYARRYMVCGVFNISTGDDNDGNTVSGTITAEQFQSLKTLLEESGGDEAKFLAFFGVEHLEEMPASKYATADGMLRKKIAEKK